MYVICVPRRSGRWGRRTLSCITPCTSSTCDCTVRKARSLSPTLSKSEHSRSISRSTTPLTLLHPLATLYASTTLHPLAILHPLPRYTSLPRYTPLPCSTRLPCYTPLPCYAPLPRYTPSPHLATSLHLTSLHPLTSPRYIPLPGAAGCDEFRHTGRAGARAGAPPLDPSRYTPYLTSPHTLTRRAASRSISALSCRGRPRIGSPPW